MPIEIGDNMMAAPEQTPADARAKKILIDGGMDQQKADELIRTCHEKFHDEIKPKIMEEMARRVLQEFHEKPGMGSLQNVLDTAYAIVADEMRKMTESEDGNDLKTIYKDQNGIELKENSNN